MRIIPFKLLLFGPACLFVIGFLSNVAATAANNGQMPVLVPGGCTAEDRAEMADEPGRLHTCMNPGSHFKALADWIVVKTEYGVDVASPGDFLEIAFDLTFKPCLLVWAVLVIVRKPYAYRP